MRKILIALAATAAFASPALANEARVEARGGVIWSDGDTQDFWGMAAGYDFDLGEKAFAGLEVSGDKIAGYEQGFGNNLYGKVAYRHYFVGNGFSDSDAVTVGLGIKF